MTLFVIYSREDFVPFDQFILSPHTDSCSRELINVQRDHTLESVVRATTQINAKNAKFDPVPD